jgi:hypothetical protein
MSLQLSDLDFNSVARIRNLQSPQNSDEPVRLADLNSAVEGLAWKDSVRVAASSNINLAAPGASVDGIAMVSGDRFLARGQTTQSQNGIYVWNAAATPATRALDGNTAAELEQAIVPVEEGSDAGTQWRQTQVNFTLDSSNVIFTPFNSGAGAATETTAGVVELATQAEVNTGTDTQRAVTPAGLAGSNYAKKKFTATIGDGSATSYTVTHNLNTRDLAVSVYRNSGNFDQVGCDIEHTSVNSVTIKFAAAPTANQFAVCVIG